MSSVEETMQTPMNSATDSPIKSLVDMEDDMILRKRRGWESLNADFEIPEDDSDDELVEEDEAGCPLPSTPEDTQLIEAEVRLLNFIL